MNNFFKKPIVLILLGILIVTIGAFAKIMAMSFSQGIIILGLIVEFTGLVALVKTFLKTN